MLRITRLSSGYWHIRGTGPCEWAQPKDWPDAARLIEASIFPEASTKFRREVLVENERLLVGLDGEGER